MAGDDQGYTIEFRRTTVEDWSVKLTPEEACGLFGLVGTAETSLPARLHVLAERGLIQPGLAEAIRNGSASLALTGDSYEVREINGKKPGRAAGL